MSRAIGFRVEPKAVHYAILEGDPTEPILLEADKFAAPKGYAEPEALTYYRKRVETLVRQHELANAGMKFTEPGARARASDSVRTRHRIEGVILQVLDENGLRIFSGAFTSVKARLGTESAKAYLDRDDLRGLDWSGMNKHAKEAMLMATAALEP